MYMYRKKLTTIEMYGEDVYSCEITNTDGLYVDESTHIKVVFQSNYYLYAGLSIACLFSCIGGPLPLCRICSGCCHCLGAFAHVAVLIYLYMVRF